MDKQCMIMIRPRAHGNFIHNWIIFMMICGEERAIGNCLNKSKHVPKIIISKAYWILNNLSIFSLYSENTTPQRNDNDCSALISRCVRNKIREIIIKNIIG